MFNALILKLVSRDSLFQWIETRGGAMAVEDCDTVATWVNYFWNDNQGNSGFADFGDTTSLGIARGMCDWAVTVSFFVSELAKAKAKSSKDNELAAREIATLFNFPETTSVLISLVSYPVKLHTRV